MSGLRTKLETLLKNTYLNSYKIIARLYTGDRLDLTIRVHKSTNTEQTDVPTERTFLFFVHFTYTKYSDNYLA